MLIDYINLDKNILNRTQFLKVEEQKEILIKIKKGESLIFMPNDIHEVCIPKRIFSTFEYHIVIYGVLNDGSKVLILIEDIRPKFEIMIPKNKNKKNMINELEKLINLELQNECLKYSKSKKNNKEYCGSNIIKGKYYKYYNKNNYEFIEFKFLKIKYRNKIINIIRKKYPEYKITHDDYSYHRVFLRDNNIRGGHLCIINNYVYYGILNKRIHPYFNLPTFVINYNNIKNYNKNNFINDKSFLLTWDIETYSPSQELPLYHKKQDKLFMIGISYHFYDKVKSLKKICLIDKPCKDLDDHLIIICHTEKNIILTFAKIINLLKPEFICGFNDSYYDWPWLIERAKTHNLINDFNYLMNPFKIKMFNFNNDADYIKKKFLKYYKHNSIKIESTFSSESDSLFLPGIIPIDVRIEFRRIYPKDEQSSLNYFLKKHNLDPKYDMKYQDMFNYYKEIDNNKKNITKTMLYNMSEIAKYCVIDAEKCQHLLVKRNIINYRRSLCSLSYTTLFDSFYRANGIRVRNLIIKYGNERGIKYTSKSNLDRFSKKKFQGAHVLEPIRGIVTSKLSIRERIKLSKSI